MGTLERYPFPVFFTLGFIFGLIYAIILLRSTMALLGERLPMEQYTTRERAIQNEHVQATTRNVVIDWIRHAEATRLGALNAPVKEDAIGLIYEKGVSIGDELRQEAANGKVHVYIVTSPILRTVQTGNILFKSLEEYVESHNAQDNITLYPPTPDDSIGILPSLTPMKEHGLASSIPSALAMWRHMDQSACNAYSQLYGEKIYSPHDVVQRANKVLGDISRLVTSHLPSDVVSIRGLFITHDSVSAAQADEAGFTDKTGINHLETYRTKLLPNGLVVAQFRGEEREYVLPSTV